MVQDIFHLIHQRLFHKLDDKQFKKYIYIEH
jgi:hypothetical protein